MVRSCIHQYLLSSATGASEGDSSFSALSVPQDLIHAVPCLDNSPPTLHWATSYSSFKSELTGHLGRLIPLSSIIVPCHMLLELTEFCSSQSALITVEDYLWSASPQLTVNSLKAESVCLSQPRSPKSSLYRSVRSIDLRGILFLLGPNDWLRVGASIYMNNSTSFSYSTRKNLKMDKKVQLKIDILMECKMMDF